MSVEGGAGPQAGGSTNRLKDNSHPKPAHLEPMGFLWRFFAAPPTLLGLVALVALALVFGAVIPQIPTQTKDLQAWLAEHLSVFGQTAGLIAAFGLFDVFHAYWFYLLFALTGLSLFVRTVDSADLAWYAARREGWTAAAFAHWGRHAPRIGLPSSLPLQNTETQLRDVLARYGYRSTRVPGLPSPNLVAGRRWLALWSEPLLFGALLAALVGLAISGMWGWQNADWWPALGESQPVGRGTPYTIRLDGFQMQQDNQGRLRGYESAITWLQDGDKVAQRVISPGHSTMLRGVAVRQVGYSPVVKIRGRDSSGHSLVFQVGEEKANASGEAEVTFLSPTVQQLVLIYGHDAALALAFEPLSKEGKPALYVTMLDQAGARQQQLVVLHRSGPVAVDGLQLEVDLEYRPFLRVDYRPAMPVVMMALMLAVVGLAIRWLVPPQLLWIVLQDGPGNSTMVHLLPLPCARGSRWPRQLASGLREVLHFGG